MAKITVDLDDLGPFPFKDCPQCDACWPLASYRGFEVCFRCLNAATP